MDAAWTNRPTGRAYNDAWWQLTRRLPHLRELDKADRSHALWLVSEWSAVETWLHTLSPTARLRLNHPRAIRRRYFAALKPKVPAHHSGTLTLYRPAQARYAALMGAVDTLFLVLPGLVTRTVGELLPDANAAMAEAIGAVVGSRANEFFDTALADADAGSPDAGESDADEGGVEPPADFDAR
jgi:hypothetical protein